MIDNKKIEEAAFDLYKKTANQILLAVNPLKALKKVPSGCKKSS